MIRIVLSLLVFVFSSNLWSANVEGVRLSNTEQTTRLVFDLDSKAQYNIFSLKSPDRLVIDLKYSNQQKSLSIPPVAGTPIQAIRHGVRDEDTLRLVLDLNQTVEYESQILGPNERYPHRLVVDLSYPEAQTATTDNTVKPVEEQIVENTTTTIAEPDLTQPVSPATANNIKETSIKQDIVIAIDSGHGGEEFDAFGKRLAILVNQETGMKAYLTGDKNKAITLQQRINRAHNSGANMFISINADTAQTTGASVYVLPENKTSNKLPSDSDKTNTSYHLAGGISLDDSDDTTVLNTLMTLSQYYDPRKH